MPGAMKQIRSTNGHAGACGLDRSECSMIVHRVIVEQNLLSSATSHIEGREIVERSGSSYASEQPVISFVPEAVFIIVATSRCRRVQINHIRWATRLGHSGRYARLLSAGHRQPLTGYRADNY